MNTISYDLEWGSSGISVLGLAWNGGKNATATYRTPETMQQFLNVLNRADRICAHNGVDADIRALEKEGYDVTELLRKMFDTRLAFHAVSAHLAGTGSFDLRSVTLLLNSRQGYRFPLDWKHYESDILGTCALDSAAVDWIVPALDRQIEQHKLQGVVDMAHKCARIFSLMHDQGIRLDTKVLEEIHNANKAKTEEIIEKYHLWEERGKKVIKKVPIWRSDKVLDICQEKFGIRPKDRKRATLVKLHATLPEGEAKEFIGALIDLGKGANDSTFVGKATQEEGGEVSFGKLDENGFIHPRYDICGSPDRAIASGPNIQQYPRPSDDPRPVKLRSAVIPLQDDHLILGVDLNSVETYTNAIEMGDWDRVRAIQTKKLSHEGTAELLNKTFGLSLNRSQGKIVNHAGDKGESPYNLARRLFNTDRPSRQQTKQCQDIFMRMLEEYPKTAKFRDELWEKAQTNPLVVTNSFGRRLMCFSRSKYGDAGERYARHDPSKKYWCSCAECGPRRDRWKYAVAFLGRSSAFDALLRIMARIYYEKRLDEYSIPIIEAHDELDYSVPANKVEHYARLAKEAFETPVPELGGIVLPAEVKWGKNWALAH